MKYCDAVGKKFNRLFIFDIVDRDKYGNQIALCICDCGNVKEIRLDSILGGYTKSCGCLNRETERKIKHGCYYHPLYQVWRNMMRRCYNLNRDRYRNYGGRGIKVCKRWHDVKNFIEDVRNWDWNNRSLDRIDNDGDYCPENCRTATQQQQQNNRSNNHWVTFMGEELTLAEAIRKYGVVSDYLCRKRLSRGKSIEEALLTPVKK